MIEVKVPAKAILFGEHAVVADCAAITACISVFMYFKATAIPKEEKCLILTVDGKEDNRLNKKQIDFITQEFKLNDQDFSLMIDITKDDSFQIAGGMGSSTAFCVGMSIVFMLAFNKMDSSLKNKDEIFQLAVRMERASNPNCSGVDTSAIVYGNIQSYKRDQPSVRLTTLPLNSLWLIFSGKIHNTAEIVSNVSNNNRKDEIFSAIAEIVKKASSPSVDGTTLSILPGELSALFSENHKQLKDLGVVSKEQDEIFNLAPFSKVSGAGQGGITVAVMLTKKEQISLKDKGYKYVQVKFSSGPEIFENNLPLHLQVLQLKIGAHWETLISSEDLSLFSKKIFCSAPSNIALLKYWGKTPKNRQLSQCNNISFTLRCFRSFTHMTLKKEDEGFSGHHDGRAQRFLNEILPTNLFQRGFRLSFESNNNFPSKCGIASSASGFCALVGAVIQVLGLEGFLKKEDVNYYQANWSRIGSGSSSRSFYDGMVSWRHQSIIQYMNHTETHDMHHFVLVINPFPKKVTSTEGHKAAYTSTFHDFRLKNANGNLDFLIEYLKQFLATGDEKAFEHLKNIIEADTMMMHSVMETMTPPAKYLTDATTSLVSFFMKFREENKLLGFFTIDAGPNIHVLYHAREVEKMKKFLYQLRFVTDHKWIKILETTQPDFSHFETAKFSSLIVDSTLVDIEASLIRKTYKYNVILLSGKRYSGKSYIADKLAEDLFGVQSTPISNNIKRVYCEENGLDYDVMMADRSLKEVHRPRMVQYMQDKLKEDKFFWDKKLWAQLEVSGNNFFIVPDGRRPNDVEFFKEISKCLFIRVECSEEVRRQRGWVRSGVDDTDSEKGLDGAKYDYVISSDGSEESVAQYTELLGYIRNYYNC